MADKKENSLREDVLGIYTPLSVAKREIWRRWNDKKLKKKVEEFLGGDVPEPLKKKPRAVLMRHVTSPNNEFFRYRDLVKIIGLDPLCLEYLGDKFIPENSGKYNLGKLYFCNGIGKNWGEKISAEKIIDFDKSEGKKIANVRTAWGEDLVTFHHNILNKSVKGFESANFDVTSLYKENGKVPSLYYNFCFSLFIRNGILFENYLISDEEKKFTEKIILPIFKKVTKVFGVKPLVVPIVPIECEADVYWWHYPGFVEKIMKKMQKK
jgi:hypothetical protein